MNAPRPHVLLGMAYFSLIAAMAAPAAANPPTSTTVVAQATASTEKGSPLPWILGGGVIVTAIGGGVYAMGRSAGKQEAQLHSAIDEYKKIVDMAPAQPSALEEELSQMKSARPVEVAATTVPHVPPQQAWQPLVQPIAQPVGAAVGVGTVESPRSMGATVTLQTAEPAPAMAMPIADVPPLSIDDVFGGVNREDFNLPPIIEPPQPTAPTATATPMPQTPTAPARTIVQPVQTVIQSPQTVVQAPPVQAPSPAQTPLPAQTPSPAGLSIVPTASSQPVIPANQAIEGEIVASESSALATTQGGSLAQPRLPQVGVIETLMQDLQTRDLEKRRKAIWELGQRGDTRAVQPLVDLMLDADSKQRSLILSALSEIGTRTLKPMGKALAISLQDENPEVRKNAIRDLTRVYDLIAQISQMVHRATEDPDAEVRDTANWALKQLNRIKPAAMENAQALKQSVSRPESLL
jgi:hypothetical protein